MMLLNFLPAWMEILVSVIGFAGFIGIATWNQRQALVTRPNGAAARKIRMAPKRTTPHQPNMMAGRHWLTY